MKEFKNFDGLVVFIINHFSKVFKNHAILKGGMVLKLLGSPRFTNDIDYVFTPFKSKKDIKDLIYNELHKIFQKKIKYQIHSTCIRYYIEQSGIKLQIEVNTELECSSIDLSTFELASKNNQKSSIIRVMSYDIALSHKLGAWNERNLYRDLYDAYFMFSILNEYPNFDILNSRLNKVKIKNKTIKMSLFDFIEKLKKTVYNLNYKNLSLELQDSMPEEVLIGLDKKIKIGISKLIDYLEKQQL